MDSQIDSLIRARMDDALSASSEVDWKVDCISLEMQIAERLLDDPTLEWWEVDAILASKIDAIASII